MAVTSLMYGLGFKAVFNKEVKLCDGNVNVALCTSDYTPNQDTHDYFNDLTNELSTGDGYTAGGATLANTTVSYTAGTNVFAFDADDTTWTTASITARYAIIYYDAAGVTTDSALLSYQDFGEDITSTADDFKITWNADGIFKVTVS